MYSGQPFGQQHRLSVELHYTYTKQILFYYGYSAFIQINQLGKILLPVPSHLYYGDFITAINFSFLEKIEKELLENNIFFTLGLIF